MPVSAVGAWFPDVGSAPWIVYFTPPTFVDAGMFPEAATAQQELLPGSAVPVPT